VLQQVLAVVGGVTVSVGSGPGMRTRVRLGMRQPTKRAKLGTTRGLTEMVALTAVW
jgi:hypothetical protein